MSFRRRSEGLGRAKVACDACRHKKAKCDGLVPCTRCRDGRNDDICCYSRRIESSEQVFSALYVKMLRRQLHITLSSFRFLVERIASGKDCRAYVPEVDTPINTIISLIQDSPEFDEEQGKEFSEMSDSELTMFSSPQELTYQPVFNDDTTKDEVPPAQHDHSVKLEPTSPKENSHKRKTSDAEHNSNEDSLTKPARGRPRKAKRSRSNDGAANSAITTTADVADSVEPASVEPTSVEPASHNFESSGAQTSRPSSADSTPLTPVSVRSDTGEDSLQRDVTYPKNIMPDRGETSPTKHELLPAVNEKAPVFSYSEYETRPLSSSSTEMGDLCMDAVIEEEESLAAPSQLDRVGTNQISETGSRGWMYQTRLPYEASLLTSQVPEMDFLSMDDCLSNWPIQAPAPPMAVSLNDLEYQMPS